MKTIKIKAIGKIGKREYLKQPHEVLKEAQRKFSKELEENPYLNGFLKHKVAKAFKEWDSTKKYHFISL